MVKKVVNADGSPARRGRPPKAVLDSKKPGGRALIGRPPGEAARLNEFKARLLATGGSRILDKMIKIALDDNHPGQMAAIKMSIDRIMPLSMFESAKNGGSTPQITINVSGISSTVDVVQETNKDDIEDVSYTTSEGVS